MAENAGLRRFINHMKDTHRVSLRTLSEKMGISPSHLCRIVKGERQLSVRLADSLCQIASDYEKMDKWIPAVYSGVTLFDELDYRDARAAAGAIVRRRQKRE